MLALTENAVAVIRTLTEQSEAPDSSGLRIATEPTGPEAAEQTLRLLMSEAPQDGDQVLDAGGARLFLDGDAADFLDDKALDAQIDSQGNVNFEVALQPE